MTNGVYVGDIKPAQGAIQGFSTVLKSELSGVVRACVLALGCAGCLLACSHSAPKPQHLF